MSTVADYVGRRVDLLAFSGVKASGMVRLTQELFSEENSGLVCTGAQKLAQRVVLEFLTEQGSMPFLEDRGTGFMTAVFAGTIRTDIDALTQYHFAMIDLVRNLQAEETDDMADDERLGSIDLLGLMFASDSLVISIRINSVAGDSREVILPISSAATV